MEPSSGHGPVPSANDGVVVNIMTYPRKISHKKSRGGCTTCKARKVKCDEARPTCTSCLLRQTECTYPPPPVPKPKRKAKTAGKRSARGQRISGRTTVLPVRSNTRSTQDSQSHNIGGGTGEGTTPPWLSPDNLAIMLQPTYRPDGFGNNLDMQFLWFFTAETSSSFSTVNERYDSVELVMRTRVVQLGFQAPYLMQSILGLSALHLQSLGQQFDLDRALHYKASSLEGYRAAVEQADPKDHTSLVTNSLILTALTSQTFRDANGKDLYILEWMIVWRGVHILIDTLGRRNLMESGLAELFHRPPFDIGRAVYAIPDILLHMTSTINADEEDYEDTKAYYDTLRYVGALYHSLRNGLNPEMRLFIMTWLTFIPQKFVELSRQQRPRALVIMAYYAVFLKLDTITWWAKGIGQRTITDIIKHLDPHWSSFMRLPIRASVIDDPAELIEMISEDTEWSPPKDGSSATQSKKGDERSSQTVRDRSWVDNRGRAMKVEGDTVILADSDDEPVFRV